jgi:site-specific DNA-cytosine methylase
MPHAALCLTRHYAKGGDPTTDQLVTGGFFSSAIAFKSGQSEAAGGIFCTDNYSPTLQSANNGSTAVPAVAFQASQGGVRRLTPEECERLMGFPTRYTAITYKGKPAADSPRYKALGNSWAVNSARWVFTRIQMVEASGF